VGAEGIHEGLVAPGVPPTHPPCERGRDLLARGNESHSELGMPFRLGRACSRPSAILPPPPPGCAPANSLGRRRPRVAVQMLNLGSPGGLPAPGYSPPSRLRWGGLGYCLGRPARSLCKLYCSKMILGSDSKGGREVKRRREQTAPATLNHSLPRTPLWLSPVPSCLCMFL
jgi:hypothetical protein